MFRYKSEIFTCGKYVFMGFPFRNPHNVVFTANTVLRGVAFWQPPELMKKSHGVSAVRLSTSGSEAPRSISTLSNFGHYD